MHLLFKGLLPNVLLWEFITTSIFGSWSGKKDLTANFDDLSLLMFVCVEVLWPSQPNGVMSSAVSLPNHTFTGQA